jgi:hypothetical protein
MERDNDIKLDSDSSHKVRVRQLLTTREFQAVTNRISDIANALIEINEALKTNKSLPGKDRQNLSKKLRKNIDNLFLLLGVAPIALNECYRGTRYHLMKKGKIYLEN